MIRTFKCTETEKIYNGIISLKLPISIQATARRKLRMLNNAIQITDLKIPPNNRLEALKGKRKGLFSIRINKQWRLCFSWFNNTAFKVKITDYH
jgi:proteic killer suppression protein